MQNKKETSLAVLIKASVLKILTGFAFIPQDWDSLILCVEITLKYIKNFHRDKHTAYVLLIICLLETTETTVCM